MLSALLASLVVMIFLTSHLIVWVSAHSWCETAFHGGWRHVSNWTVVIVSALCATWCYGTTFFLVIAYAFGLMDNYLGMVSPWIAVITRWITHSLTVATMDSLSFGRGMAILPVLCGFGALSLKSWAMVYRGRNLVQGSVCCAETFLQMYGLREAHTNEGRVMTLLRAAYYVVYATLFLLWPSALSGGYTTYKVFERARREHVRTVARQFEAEHLLHEAA